MGKHWQRVPRDVGGASSLETSRLRSGRARSHLICLKMSLLLAGHLVQMTCKGPCQAKPGEDSAGFACEKQRDWRLLEGGPRENPSLALLFPLQPLGIHLQQLLGRPAPLLVRLQAALQEVPQQSRQAPGLLQLRGPVLPDQTASLRGKQTLLKKLCQLPSHPRVLTATPVSQPQSPGTVSSLAEMLHRAHFSKPTKKAKRCCSHSHSNIQMILP